MRTFWIIGFIFVILLALGGYWWWSGGRLSGQVEATPAPVATVSPTGLPTGFIQQVPLEVQQEWEEDVGQETLGDEGSVMVVPTEEENDLAEEIEEVVVSIEDTGFSPARVVIVPGTTVRFVNNGQASHWPASDPHPAHDGLPGFDAGKPLATGETYAYTFSQTGEWGYHDHLLPQLTGMVVVSK